MSKENICYEFSVQIYGDITPFNRVASKARVRIFYRGKNRNGTFITDQFAEKLISTLPYVPIKGIYSEYEEDYSDHGLSNDQGRIYGIVPENPNFAWEKHLDVDGVEREYACADVILFTSLYKEASEIAGKAQSMELYADSIEGSWQVIDGQKYYVFTDACFLGLQVLGEDVEPCFEGAAFYKLISSFSKLIDDIDKITQSTGGKQEMEKLNFKLSDNEKFELLFMAMNPNCDAEHNFEISNMIGEVYDDYFISYNLGEDKTYKVFYTKNEDSVEIGESEEVFVEYVTKAEKASLETIRTLNNNTYEKAEEVFEKGQNFDAEVEKYEAEKVESENAISTLTQEKETVESQYVELTEKYTAANDTINSQNEELETLRAYKLNIEAQEKEEIINKYSERLDAEVLNSFREKASEMTAEALDKELAYTLIKSEPSIFSNSSQNNRIPKPTPKTGIEGILDKYN